MFILQLKSFRFDRKTAKLWTNYSCNFALGWHDAALSALLPYIQAHYSLGFRAVSLLFVSGFVGTLLGMIFNVPLTKRVNFGLAFAVSVAFLMLSCVLLVIPAPFAVLVLAYAIAGVATGLICARQNTYVPILPNPRFKLGMMHAIWGCGALICPLAATAFIQSGRPWRTFFYTSLALGCFNLAITVFSFQLKDEMEKVVMSEEGNVVPEVPAVLREQLPGSSTPGLEDVEKSNYEDALTREALQQDLGHLSIISACQFRAVPVLSFFVMCSSGIEIALSGWILTFLLEERDGNSNAGYVGTGFFGGLAISRLVSVPLVCRLGEGPVMITYSIVGIALLLVLWFVDNLVVNAVAVAFIGFAKGPMFPGAVSLLSQRSPRSVHAAGISLMMIFARLGTAVFPFLVGSLAETYGILVVLPPLNIALFVGMAVSTLLIPKAKVV